MYIATPEKGYWKKNISEIDLQFQDLIWVETYICSPISNAFSLFHQQEENTKFNLEVIQSFSINKKAKSHQITKHKKCKTNQCMNKCTNILMFLYF